MPELTSEHHELPPMMSLVGDKIREYVTHIEGQVAPDVGCRWWHPALRVEAQDEKRLDAAATAPESRNQLPTIYSVEVDEWGNGDSVLLAQRLDPPAS